MAAIDELKEYFAKLESEGSIRTDLPPKKEEKYYNPVAETMPRDKLLKLRDERICHVVRWAYEKSPFYRKMWDEAKVSPDEIHGYDDLEKLPFFRKSGKWGMRIDQMENPPYGTRIVEELLPYINILFRSTGTTGFPTYQPWIDEELRGVETFTRVFYAAGARNGGVFLHFAPTDKGYAATPAFDRCARNIGCVSTMEGVVRLVTAPEDFASDIPKMLEQLKKCHKPIFTVINTPLLMGIGGIFAKLGKESPFDCLNQQGAPMTPESRAAIRKAHPKAQVSYSYSTTELNCGGECLPSAAKDGALGWHMWEDLYVFEVIDPETGKRLPKGGRGELVLTTFIHHSVPLIRFSLEDVMVNDFDDSVCECGRTHRRWLNPIQGRTRDIFKVKGRDLLPWDVEKIIPKVPEAIGPFQIVADAWDMDVLKLKIETTRTLPDEEYKGKVRNIFQDVLGVPVELELLGRGALIALAGYKAVTFVDNRPKKE